MNLPEFNRRQVFIIHNSSGYGNFVKSFDRVSKLTLFPEIYPLLLSDHIRAILLRPSTEVLCVLALAT